MGRSLRISKMAFLPFGRKTEDVSRVTRILIRTSLPLAASAQWESFSSEQAQGPGGSEVEGVVTRHSGP